MNLNKLKTYYYSSPAWIQYIISLIPFKLRNGKEYREWKKFLKESNVCSESYQLRKLKETVNYAYNTVPFYKNLYDEVGVDISEIKTIEDFLKLPIINKEMVRDNFDMFLSNNEVESFYVTTGGTTGKPMKFFQSNNVWKKELAFVNNLFGKYGYITSKLKASFRGGDFNKLSKNIYWKWNPINKEIHFSPFHINSQVIDRYVMKLNELKPKFIHAYPSAISTFIHNVLEKNLTLNFHVKAVFLISENYSEQQISEIKEFFKCEIMTFYGHSERLIFAPTIDDKLEIYQPNPYYGYTELINKDNYIINTNDVLGELIGTSFDNLAMPLIRYKTGDFTSYHNFNNKQFNKIEGRWKQEFLDGLDNIRISLTALNIHSAEFDKVLNCQFFQQKIGYAILRVLPNSEYLEVDSDRILAILNKRAGHAISFKIESVESLILTERGKVKNIIKGF
mgnify:CR=1 FL=1